MAGIVPDAAFIRGDALAIEGDEGERSAKITNRRQMASMLGVTESALRNRVQRLRDRLEDCMQGCASHPLGQVS